MIPFAVVDFETTGLVPEKTDRVVEVAVVLTDGQGEIEAEWTTLVNPQRDIGATRIHGISAADVVDAPCFCDIADHLLDLLANRVVVAHNASFDMRFLHRELALANYQIAERPAALCSMKWAGRVFGAAKLAHCCEALGIVLTEAHSAIGDARATAQLISCLMSVSGEAEEWHADVKRCSSYVWPGPFTCGTVPSTVMRGQAPADPFSWLRSVLQAAWIPGNPENEAAYMLMLENALLDRSISHTEGRELVATAEASGLSRATVGRLHHDYLRAVAVEALADEVVTDDERADLEAIAAALGLGAPYVDEALAWAQAQGRPADTADRQMGFSLGPGDRVVFTGDMARSREDWVAAVGAVGLASGGVTKSTRLVVAADPDSMSGKAAKARKYGIPIVSESAFAKMFDEYRDKRAAKPG